MATVAAAGLRLIGAARRPAALARALSAGTVIVSTATTGNTMAQAPGNLPGRPIGGGVRELSWDDLMPPDWDPMKLLSGKDLDSINDGDPRRERIMREIREQWDGSAIAQACMIGQAQWPSGRSFNQTLPPSGTGLWRFP